MGRWISVEEFGIATSHSTWILIFWIGFLFIVVIITDIGLITTDLLGEKMQKDMNNEYNRLRGDGRSDRTPSSP